jgi:hypothetical protein
MSAEQATLEPHTSPVTESAAQHPDREIQEDVMNVPFVAWIGTVTTILITVSVIVLIGVYYLTKGQEMERRQAEADGRITDMEAQREIDALVVDGYYKFPDVDDGQGNVTRGTVSIPVSEGMRRVVEDARSK